MIAEGRDQVRGVERLVRVRLGVVPSGLGDARVVGVVVDVECAVPVAVIRRAPRAVGLLGPVRMDYDKAIRSVRAAAFELSRFVEEIYAEN